MTIEYDEKGKFFTDIISKIPVRAVMQTTAQLIHGKVHVRRGGRLKDELDIDEPFLGVTDAIIMDEGGKVEFQTPFLAVRRSHIVWLFPDDGEAKA